MKRFITDNPFIGLFILLFNTHKQWIWFSQDFGVINWCLKLALNTIFHVIEKGWLIQELGSDDILEAPLIQTALSCQISNMKLI